MVEAGDDYSAVADEQPDAIEAADVDLYEAVIAACHLIFDEPGKARAISAAINTREGIRLVLPIAGHSPYKVFWSTEGPRVEAVFPYHLR